jgi:hypothetical protein
VTMWMNLGYWIGCAIFAAHSRLPSLRNCVRSGFIHWRTLHAPGPVFDLVLPLDEVTGGYRAMDERRAIKAVFKP